MFWEGEGKANPGEATKGPRPFSMWESGVGQDAEVFSGRAPVGTRQQGLIHPKPTPHDTGCRPIPWHFPLRPGGAGYSNGGLPGGQRLSAFQGNEINHRKKNKEYRVLTDIMLLQAAAENYCLEPQHPFTAWFWAVERLSEDDR
ncbi:uncharacterized protein LOC123392518 isoform X2 [Mustela putorius furo]|uniref:Uncharacterized protein LOC123392518 isoform X2 n=1 Tax=Mustela putorius furo TaxID=9669 RepID=A0A8U0S9U6_MUSPF|nr:uncharacterized protein LOC123392518 isoform X2 [Mustela putorius furo]